MPRPFPFPFTIGTDICSIPRIRRLLVTNRGNQFIQRLLIPQEREEGRRRWEGLERWEKWVGRFGDRALGEGVKGQDVWSRERREIVELGVLKGLDEDARVEFENSWRALHLAAGFLAGRFAAKEAIIKAHHHRRLTYADIWVQRQRDLDGQSRPPVAIVVSEKGGWEEGQEVRISISHDGEYAVASCLGVETEGVSGGRRDGGGGNVVVSVDGMM